MNTNSNTEKLVLVTGGAGFIAAHCIIQLLNAGYNVRATLRNLNRIAEVKAMLKEGGAVADDDRLTFIQADLSADTNWAEAVSGCTYVLHVASPTPIKDYKHEDEMIIPAREGVLRVLRAAREAGVKRVVLTSAIGAVVYGHPNQKEPFDETTWTNVDSNAPAYQKSKTLAERAAWEFIEKEGNGLELAAVNPVGVMGPVLGADYSHSIHVIKNLLTGKMAGCPKINSGFVDVRDVADLHLRAMINPAASSQRFIATAGESIWMVDVARILKENLGEAAAKVNAKELPSMLLRVVALKDPTVKAIIPLLGRVMNVTSAKAIKTLGWSPRSTAESILATAESLIRLNLLDQ
ncbi:dihydroflavonol-4-reductase [Mucilaginibacter yixingensis]|uniref:Dihydroflavonol-4-reductase n=1 Tax=Mucilaginibacter yixingensis TaxID=1295612 RepID=A0A2T5JBB8_9SPHI|nr:aldehyde reductase [Mucilaginibacter yixingensis]PTQ98171.1 dihydroflavonol-4-reductase [Mucilaginibacter yixingensis]